MRRIVRLALVASFAFGTLGATGSSAHAYCDPKYDPVCTNRCQQNAVKYFVEHGQFPTCTD